MSCPSMSCPMATEPASAAAADPLHRALADERRRNIARGNLTRALVIPVFLALFLILTGILGETWAGRRASVRVLLRDRMDIALGDPAL